MTAPLSPLDPAAIAARIDELNRNIMSGSSPRLADVLARQDVPALLARVAELEAEVVRLRDAELVAWLLMNVVRNRSDLPRILHKPCKDYADIPGEIGDACRKALIEARESGRLYDPKFYFFRAGDDAEKDGEIRILISAGDLPVFVLPDAAREIAAAARATTDAKEETP